MSKEDKGTPIGRVDIFSCKNESDERSSVSIDLMPLKEFAVFILHTNNFDQFEEIVSLYMKKSNGQQISKAIVIQSYLFSQKEYKDTNVLVNIGNENELKEVPYSLTIPFDVKVDKDYAEAFFNFHLKPDTELYIEFFE